MEPDVLQLIKVSHCKMVIQNLNKIKIILANILMAVPLALAGPYSMRF